MWVALGIAMSGRCDAGTAVFGETVAWRVSRSIMRHVRGVWPSFYKQWGAMKNFIRRVTWGKLCFTISSAPPLGLVSLSVTQESALDLLGGHLQL